jgi:WS/DGAT/MGAT family acyltransferase
MPRQALRGLRSAPCAVRYLDQNPFVRGVPGAKPIARLSRRLAAARPRRRDGGILEGRTLRAPRTMLNAPIGAHRRVALTRQSLDDVKAIKNHFGVTVNDVVVAICAGALHSWLSEHGELPAEPLLALVPVSVRTEAERGTFGNRVSAMLAPIPTHLADPEDRLRAAHEAMRSAKERHQALPATAIQDANEMIPPALFARAARVASRIAASRGSEAPVNTIISNVPGSPVPLYLAGARVEALFPVSGVMHGVGVNITVMSYCGGLDFGIVADRDLVDDAWPLAAALAEAQAELVALVAQADAVAGCANGTMAVAS